MSELFLVFNDRTYHSNGRFIMASGFLCLESLETQQCVSLIEL